MKKTKSAAAPASPVTGPNMSKQYRKELRALETQMGRASRDQIRHHRATGRAVAKIENVAVAQIRAIKRESAKLDKGTVKQLAAFQKRRAILIGRLS